MKNTKTNLLFTCLIIAGTMNNFIFTADQPESHISPEDFILGIMENIQEAQSQNITAEKKQELQSTFLNDISDYVNTYGSFYQTNLMNPRMMHNPTFQRQYISDKTDILQPIAKANDFMRAIDIGMKTFNIQKGSVELQLYNIQNKALTKTFKSEKTPLYEIINYIINVITLTPDQKANLQN